MLEAWNEALGSWALPVWMAVAVLGVIWLAVPPSILRAGRGGVAPVGGWAASAALLPLAALPALLLIPFDRAPLAILGGLALPLVALVLYLVARATAPVCDDCGREMRRRWRYCPFHEHAARGNAFGGMGAAAGALPLPSPVPMGIGAPIPAWNPGPGFLAPPAPFPGGFGGAGAVLPPPPTGPSVGSLSVATGPNRGQTFSVTTGGVTVGRDLDCEVRLDDPAVSGRHARIVVTDGRAQVIDLGSSNGTSIGGRPIDRAYLFDGDRIEVGDSVLTYQDMRR